MAVEIAKLGIEGYRQFIDTVLDFTDPASGKPLEKVCLIGGNGTGKSTVLQLLGNLLNLPGCRINGKAFKVGLGVRSSSEDFARLFEERVSMDLAAEFDLAWQSYREDRLPTLRKFELHGESKERWNRALSSLVGIYCPPDSEQNAAARFLMDVPVSNLDRALQWNRSKRTRFIIGQETVDEFWTALIGLIKEREARQIEHQRRPENRERIVREVEEGFLRDNPDILKEMSDFWMPILDKAGLEFDYANAALPVQLTDNLSAYIRLKNAGDRIPYAELSTGIRNFIFKLGHIFTIFRGKPENRGVLLVDEPENSLHPDFLFDLVEHYRRAAPGAQLFMATHSPIVAAQFRPEERFILEFDETGGVSVRRGVTPEGDDPNDVLLRDFAVRTLYGTKGLEKWKRFRELDRLIQSETDAAQRRVLLMEYMDLGKAYNFAPDEVSG